VPIEHHADAGYCPQNRFAENGPKPEGWCELEEEQTRDTRHETRDNPQPPTHNIPLAGDIAAAALKHLGAEKLAAWWTKISGVGCGCAGRREKLNRLDRAVRRKLKRFL
jgi:hypothetical protein